MSMELQQAREQGLAAIAAADSLEALNGVKAEVFGKKSALTAVQRALGGLGEHERREQGRLVNEVRDALVAAEAERRRVLSEQRDRVVLAAEAVDVTLPPRTPKRGSLHPVMETMEAMVDVLVGLGYEVVGGPEVESDWFNFTALNIPPDHPARSLWDTIYVHDLVPPGPSGTGGLGGTRAPEAGGQSATLLRTHTSPVQARVMLDRPPPVFVAVPGRTFRMDTPDATHLPVFHQIEGLAVAEHLSFADLRGTLAEFCRGLLGPESKVRMRPSYFPFTEPSAEFDAWYVPPDGGQPRWIELGGCGMVNPNVFRAVGYDPEAVSGFAFGFGVERMAMLRHGIADLRLFIENDLRFLSAF